MKIEINQFIQPAKTVKINIPNLSKKHQMLPVRFYFKHKSTGEDNSFCEPSLISCKIRAGNEIVADWSQARFSVNKYIDLEDRLCKLQEGRDINVELMNVSNYRGDTRDSLTVQMVVEYMQNYGGVIYQNTITNQMNLSSILENIREVGHCTRLLINLEKSLNVNSLDLIPNFNSTGNPTGDDDASDSWLCSLTVEEQEENSGNFAIDFIDSDLMEYSNYLDFFKINLNTNAEASNTDDAVIHVVAYGYPC